MMMKGDVLSGFSKIKICNAYKTKNGIINYFPYDINSNEIEPLYTELEGWKEDITSISSKEEFPENFNNYILFLEKELKAPIQIVSVGPDRKQTIFR